MKDIITGQLFETIGAVVGTVILVVSFIKSTSILMSTIQKKENLPPLVPYKLPFLGSTIDYYKNPFVFTKTNSEKYGSVFRMHFRGELVTVIGPEDLSEAFHHPDLCFLTSKLKYIGDNFFQETNKHVFPERVIKKIILKHLTPNLNDYSSRAFEVFLKEAERINEPEFTLPDLLPLVKKFVSKYSASAFVGLELCEDKDLMYAFEQSAKDIGDEIKPGILRIIFPLMNKLYKRFISPKTEAVQKYRKLIRGAIEKEIYKRKHERKYEAKKDNGEILSYILSAYPHEINNDYLESITTVILGFIFAGIHTGANTINQILYCLVKYPEHIQALREEQQEALEAEGIAGTDKILYTPGFYRRLVKLDSFIRESLRMSMGGIDLPQTNISNQDIIFKSGAVVKPGKEVFVNTWLVHHDPENLKGQIHLEKFNGFRFAGLDKPAIKASTDNIIFGLGKRTCPGRWFAAHQIKGIISYLIRNYDMTAVGEISIQGIENDYNGPPSGQVKFVKRKQVEVL